MLPSRLRTDPASPASPRQVNITSQNGPKCAHTHTRVYTFTHANNLARLIFVPRTGERGGQVNFSFSLSSFRSAPLNDSFGGSSARFLDE